MRVNDLCMDQCERVAVAKMSIDAMKESPGRVESRF